MNFDIFSFFKTNKRFFIWTAFFGLLYLVRGLFTLVFLTFILCFIFNNLIEWLNRKTRLPRRLWTIVIYMIFVALIATALSFIAPKLVGESTAFLGQIPETQSKVHAYLDRIADNQPELARLSERLKESLSLESLLGTNRKTLVTVAVKSLDRGSQYVSYFLLGTLFSFLILFDFPNLRSRTLALRETKLRGVYEETADSVARFALVVGSAFQAQIMIACVNTFLTALGLWILNIHPIVLLSTIVFTAGLIPVLGVFISSIPILLVAFNIGGLKLVAWALFIIIIVHTIEAYILNPNIFSAVLKINPVLVLMILYIGHSLFGLWGVILGVPISVYIYRYAILGLAMKPDSP